MPTNPHESKLEAFFLDLCKLCREHNASIEIANNQIVLTVTHNGAETADTFGVFIDQAGSLKQISRGTSK